MDSITPAVVPTDGEVALIFLGGTYSHAVRKEALLAVGSGPATGLWRSW